MVFRLTIGLLPKLFFILCSCGDNTLSPHNTDIKNDKVVINFTPDKSSFLRNTGMGWTIYDDAIWEPANATNYWEQQGEYAVNYASVFYIRWRWSDMEPEEGKYAWEFNENFKALVKGALDRDLKLAFRVYIDGQDNQHQATPNFVKEAGAKGYITTDGRDHWNPYVDDPIFQEKYSNFVKAFAAQFDDAEIVDYVDVYNIGHWGEGHHAGYLDYNANKDIADRWLINLYGNNFKNVIPVFLSNILNHINAANLNEAFAIQQMAGRRDGLGSKYLEQREINFLQSIFPQSMVIGELAYYGGNDLSGDWKPFRNDHLYSSNANWKDNYRLGLEHALNLHSNYLDLRNPLETKGWVQTAPEYVQKFIEQGGYRLAPVKIEIDKSANMGEEFTIEHEWLNLGVGVCPNRNKRWNNKFKVAFALFDNNQKIVDMFIDEEANPGDWIGNKSFSYVFKIKALGENLSKGKYTLATAIINTKNNNKPGIKLAIDKQVLINDWSKITELTIN